MQHIGRYEIVRELGRGAMGVVFKARDPLIGRSVALKTITAGVAQNPDLLERFYREAKSAGLLQHPNIVTIYELSESEGSPFIAMEYVEGESLEQVIERRPPLPLAQRLGYIVQACRAFDYAHQRGVVHRDIKPANIMITIDGVVKVVDFGIARLVDTSKTQTGHLLGTLSYMSPEQLNGRPADERCDIWSLGVVLYESMSYRKPFTGDNHGALLRAILNEEPQSIQEAVPECPAKLQKVVHRALSKSSSDRYQSMEMLLLELEPIWTELQQETVQRFVDDGRKLMAQGDKSEACHLLRQAVLIDNKNPAAKALLDELYASLGENQIAARVGEIVARGRKLLEEGLFFDARVEVQSALKLDPADPEARRLQQDVQSQQARAQDDWDPQKILIGRPAGSMQMPPDSQVATEGLPTEPQSGPSRLSIASSHRSKRAAAYSLCGAVAIIGLGLAGYHQYSRSRRVAVLTRASTAPDRPSMQTPIEPPPAAAPMPVPDEAAPSATSLENQQRHLMELAHTAADAGDYKAADDRLEEADKIDGPLKTSIADLRRQFNEQAHSASSQRAAQQEQSLWDGAMQDMQNGELDEAEKLLRETIALPESGSRRSDAERYVDEIIPKRRHGDQLWADLQQESRSLSADHLENELKILDKILILGGARQQQANQMREALITLLAQANATKSQRPLAAVPAWGRQRIDALQNQFDQAVQQGNAEALQQLQNLRPQFKALPSGDSSLALDARDYLNNLIPKAEKQMQADLASADSDAAADAEYETAVEHYKEAVTSQEPNLALSRVLTEFRQIVSFGGVRASEAAQYVNVLIPRVLAEQKYSASKPMPSDQ